MADLFLQNSMEDLFILILPAAAFVGGIYLAYRGFRRLSGPPGGAVSGTVRCKDDMRSRMTNERCAYSRVVVERYQGGHQPWKEIFSFERRAPFMVGGRDVDPAHADFRLSRSFVAQGYVRRDKGPIERAASFITGPLSGMPSLSVARGAFDLTQEVRENEFLEPDAYTSIMALAGAREKVAPYSRQPLRISEFMLREGGSAIVVPDPAAHKPEAPAQVSKAGGAPVTAAHMAGSASGAGRMPPVAGTLEYPLLIYDSAEAAGSSMREKALLSILVGSILVAASLFLALFILGVI